MSNYTKSTNFATKDNLSPGDPLKIVRGTEIDTEFNNISTAISTKTDNSAAAITGGSITGITDLAIADGGTGASTATAALNNLLPSQTGNGTKYLQTDGSNATWDAVSLSTSDITGTLPVANGGTGVTSSTGTGSVVLSNSPTLVTPALGTPASGVATNLTGLPISTGVSGLGTGVATFLGTPSSANLASAVSDETGSGALVFANTPTLVAPLLGTPTSGNFSTGTFTWPTFNQNTTGTAAGLSSTLAIASGGTGATTAGGALTSLGAYAASNPSGYTSNTGTVTSVGGTGTVNGLTLTGTVTTSGNLTLGGTLSGVSLTSQVTGTLPTANGGTNLTSFTSGGVVYASSTSALATGSALTFDGTNLETTGRLVVRTTASPSFAGQIGYSAFGGTYIWPKAGSTDNFNLYDGLGNSAYQINSSYSHVWSVSATEALRLTSTSLYTASGINVGIGLSNPAYKLDVVGTGSIISATRNDTNRADMIVTNSGGTVSFGINSSTGGWLTNGLPYYGYILGPTSSSYGLQFGVGASNTAALTINPAGNLGLGVTPSAWGSPFLGAFEGKAGTALVGRSDAAQTFLFNNLYFNGTNYIRKATGYGNFILLDGYSGGIGFNIAGTGSGGTTASPTQAMTLDASGNLGVGTTSPAVRLNVTDSADGGNSGTIRLGSDATYYAQHQFRYNSSEYRFGTYGAGQFMSLYTAGSERARITSGGYFKASNEGTYIGSTGSYHEFRGNSANSYVVITTCTNATPLSEYIQDWRFSAASPNDGNARFWNCEDSTANRAYMRSNGGLSNYQANDTNLSDRREKTNFAPAKSYLDTICAIPVQTFNYIDQNLEEDGGLTLGVVAQDVQAVAPELVTETNWGTNEEPKMRLSIYQTDLQYALMKALQELKAEFDAYKASHP